MCRAFALALAAAALAPSSALGRQPAAPASAKPPNGALAGSCSAGIPPEGVPADVSHPTSVVGTGDPTTCTFESLTAAVTKGGIVTFDCGPDPITLFVQQTLKPPMSNGYLPDAKPFHTVVDGGGLVTLTGGGNIRLFDYCHGCVNDTHGSFRVNHDTLTLQVREPPSFLGHLNFFVSRPCKFASCPECGQHLGLINGRASPIHAPFPTCPPNSTANISNADCSTVRVTSTRCVRLLQCHPSVATRSISGGCNAEHSRGILTALAGQSWCATGASG